MTARMGWNDHQIMHMWPVPWWLGRADTDFARGRDLLLPVPFNLIWSLLIGLYVRLRIGWLARGAERKAFESGFAEGRKVGELAAKEDAKTAFLSGLAELLQRPAARTEE